MPEDSTSSTDTGSAGGTADTAQSDSGTQPEQSAHEAGILKRMIAQRDELKDVRAQLAAMQAAESTRKTEAAEKAGHFEELYKELAPRLKAAEERNTEYATQETARLEALEAKNKAAIEALPEQYRGLIPEGLAPDRRAEQIEKLRALSPDKPEHPRGGRVNGGKPKGITDEAKSMAASMGMPPEVAQGILDRRAKAAAN